MSTGTNFHISVVVVKPIDLRHEHHVYCHGDFHSGDTDGECYIQRRSDNTGYSHTQHLGCCHAYDLNPRGGGHTVTAAYGGATEFATSNGTVSRTINQATSSTSLGSLLNPATYGQETTLTATVSSAAGTPTGSVTFKDGVTSLGSGTLNGTSQAALVVALPVGTHSHTATYGGSSNFSGSTSSAVSESISKATTTTTLTSSPNPSTTGQTVNFVATVTGQYDGSITGTVTFKRGTNTILGTATVVGGAARLSLSNLGTGSHVVTGSYGGDANSTASTSAAVTQTVVGPATTTTSLSSSPNPSFVSQLVTFTAVVTSTSQGTPTGTVTFRQGSSTVLTIVPLSSGQATFRVGLGAGPWGITAVYNGDAQFAGSTSATLIQIVIKNITATTLSASPNPSNAGQVVTFSVSVTSSLGVLPTGAVNINEGNTTLGTATLNATGNGSFSTSTLASGRQNIKAVYVGDARNAGSTSNTVQQVVH